MDRLHSIVLQRKDRESAWPVCRVHPKRRAAAAGVHVVAQTRTIAARPRQKGSGPLGCACGSDRAGTTLLGIPRGANQKVHGKTHTPSARQTIQGHTKTSGGQIQVL